MAQSKTKPVPMPSRIKIGTQDWTVEERTKNGPYKDAADFKARFKISLADAFAAALAKEKKAELVTGDREFKALEKEIKIEWLK